MLTVDNVTKRYTGNDRDALAGVDLSVGPGEFLALMGPSGCGKSTLLHLCGAMDRASGGAVHLAGTNLSGLSDDRLTLLRRERIGFVFQFFNLLPTLTLMENVALPLLLAGTTPTQATTRARELGERVGLTARLDAYPAQVSGGELQRAAIARAIVHRPALLIADEPTGNLDSANGARVVTLLQELNVSLGLTILLATHDAGIAAAAHRTVQMRDGRIVGERRTDAADSTRRATN